jgi:putative DNA primase/helicase
MDNINDRSFSCNLSGHGHTGAPPDFLAYARRAVSLSLSVVPARMDGSKAPCGEWKVYQSRRATQAELRNWFPVGRTGLGIVTGEISGHLEILDFDSREHYKHYRKAAKDAGLGDLLDRVEAGYKEETPNGIHLPWFCSEIASNTKLARRELDEIDPETGEKIIKTLIEIKGRGGFCVVSPSHGAVHPSGKPYVLVRGDLSTIVTISPEERRSLLDLARTFDEMPPRPQYEPTGTGPPTGDRPGDLFNAKADWADILEPHGWVFVYARGETSFWRRPGKVTGISASTNYMGCSFFYCFTTSTGFDSEKGYTKFSAYALLNHGGDYAAAARALIAKGYVRPRSAFIRVPIQPVSPWISRVPPPVSRLPVPEPLSHGHVFVDDEAENFWMFTQERPLSDVDEAPGEGDSFDWELGTWEQHQQ